MIEIGIARWRFEGKALRGVLEELIAHQLAHRWITKAERAAPGAEHRAAVDGEPLLERERAGIDQLRQQRCIVLQQRLREELLRLKQPHVALRRRAWPRCVSGARSQARPAQAARAGPEYSCPIRSTSVPRQSARRRRHI